MAVKEVLRMGDQRPQQSRYNAIGIMGASYNRAISRIQNLFQFK